MVNEVDKLKIESVFEESNFYEIPSYQRAYTWKEEQWNNFFQDICENEEGYFLGSMICVKNEHNTFEVIDGQQRLTTISLFLNAIYFVLKNNFKSLQMQDNPDKMISDIAKFGNLKKAIFDDDKKRLRLKLSSSGDNLQFYQALCAKENSLGSFAQDVKYKESNLFKAYEFFKAKLGGKLANKEQNLDEIFEILRKLEKAILVKITVLDEMSAFVLFESVNDRGVELSPIDLIKNLFIKRFVEEQNLKSEDINKRWQEIVDENITKLKDQIRFIRHFYNAFNTEFGFALTNYPFVTESKLMKVYYPLIKSNKKYKVLFDELIKKSRIYKRLLDPSSIEENDEYIDKKYIKTLEKINQIGFLPAYPFIMFLFSQKKNFDLTYILETLQKWNVRRQITNFPTTSGLDVLFANLCDEISKISTQKELDEAVYNYLTQDKHYSNDKRLKDELEETAYETNNKLLRYILIEIENSKRNSEEKINFWEKLSKTKFVWELEHILPQNPRKDSDWFTFFNGKEMKKEVHKIGNITLSAYNPSLSNRSFSEKSNLENGGYKSNKVKINDFVAKQDIWTKEQIKQRGEILIDEICELIKIKK